MYVVFGDYEGSNGYRVWACVLLGVYCGVVQGEAGVSAL